MLIAGEGVAMIEEYDGALPELPGVLLRCFAVSGLDGDRSANGRISFRASR
jgi:hypothetical protein